MKSLAAQFGLRLSTGHLMWAAVLIPACIAIFVPLGAMWVGVTVCVLIALIATVTVRSISMPEPGEADRACWFRAAIRAATSRAIAGSPLTGVNGAAAMLPSRGAVTQSTGPGPTSLSAANRVYR